MQQSKYEIFIKFKLRKLNTDEFNLKKIDYCQKILYKEKVVIRIYLQMLTRLAQIGLTLLQSKFSY